jgi:hypothetical protein
MIAEEWKVDAINLQGRGDGRGGGDRDTGGVT